jgi:hypothetical protein
LSEVLVACLEAIDQGRPLDPQEWLARRETTALAALPAKERAACQRLQADVATLPHRAQEQALLQEISP